MQVEFDPVSRVAGPLALHATVDGGRVSDASAMAQVFRGYELLLRERDVRDAIFISSRACGICGGAHALMLGARAGDDVRGPPAALRDHDPQRARGRSTT